MYRNFSPDLPCCRPIVNVVIGRLTGAQEKEALLTNIVFLEGNECSQAIREVIEVMDGLDLWE